MERHRGNGMIVRIPNMLAILLLLAGFQQAVFSQSVFDTCGAEGSAVRSDVRAINRKKNREGFPTDAQINRSVTFGTMLSAREAPATFREGDAAEITAYVCDVKIGAVESVNCAAKDHWHRDTHIELTLDPNDANNPSKILVVEVTPRFRQAMKDRGVDWSQQALRDKFLGRWVTVRGWLFYDALHADESAGSGSSKIWRGSPWEIHPVTDLTVTTRPSAIERVPASTPAESSVKRTPQSPSNATGTQCQGVTKAGRRCSRTTTDPSGFCWQHQR